MSIRLIALDLDGTLLDSAKHVSVRNRAALRQAMDRGIRIVIASGRPKSALPQEELEIEGISYAITSNGSSIFHLPDMKRIYANDIDSASIRKLLPLIEGADFPCEAAIGGRCYTPRAYFEDPTLFGIPVHMREYVQATRTPIDDMYAFIRDHSCEIEGIFMLIADQALKERTRRQVAQAGDLYITASTPYYLEIADGSVSKAAALDFLTDRLGTSREETAAFGDSLNDLELIEYAGAGIAMGNASDQLKASAQFVTLSNDQDGVAEFIENNCL